MYEDNREVVLVLFLLFLKGGILCVQIRCFPLSRPMQCDACLWWLLYPPSHS